GFEAFMELNRAALQAEAAMNGKGYGGDRTWDKKWVGFPNRRLKEDFAIAEQLAASKTVRDMYGGHAGCVQNACSHYQSQVGQMTKLGKSLADDTMQAIQSRIDEARETRASN